MKKGNLIASLIIILIVFSYLVLAAHTATVSLTGYAPNYETNNMQFAVKVENTVWPANNIVNVTLSYPGYSKTYVIPNWQYDGDINWYSGSIAPLGSQTFIFNATGQQVSADTQFNWTMTTIDTVGASQANTLSITILNDLNPPNITSITPNDYSFVKNETVNFTITVNEAETSIPNTFYIGYDDNNLRTDLGVVTNYLALNKLSDNLYSILWNPIQGMQPYIDYRFINLTDSAGNNYNEGNNLPHHLYIDYQRPAVILNQLSNNFLTNNQNQAFSFNVSDNSFATLGQGFAPDLNCSLYINNLNIVSTILLNNADDVNFNVNLGLVDGTYPWYVSCEDKAGWITQSEIRNVILDTTGPVIILNAPADGSIIPSGIQIALIITDSPAGVSSRWYNNGSDIIPFTGTIDTSNWSEGINNIVVYANDTLDNVNKIELNFTVDKTPPIINLLSPNNNSITNGDVDFVFNATDNYDNILTCNLFMDGNNIYTIGGNSGQITTISDDLGLSEGDHIWYVNCMDDVTLSSNSETRIIRVDTTPPVLPDLTIFNSLNDTNDDNGLIDINLNITDLNGLSNCELYIDGILSQTNSTADFTANLVMSNNQYNIMIGCNDTVDNWLILPSLTLYYDAIAPNIFNVSNSSITTSNAVISWNTDESSTTNVTYWINPNSTSSSSLVVYEQSHSISLSGLSSSTTYNYDVSSSDRWGNTNNLTGFNFTTQVAQSGGSEGSGGGGGSSSGGSPSNSGCVENWNCSAWNSCIRDGILGVQTRGCVDLNNCGTENYKPALLQNCKLSFEEEQIQENPIEKIQEEIKEMEIITGGVVAYVINSTPFRALIAALIIGLLIAGFLRWMKERPPKKINIV